MKKINKRLISIILILCLAAGGVYGIAQAVMRTTGSGQVLVVQAGELNYGGWFYDEASNTSGRVTSEAMQSIYLSDTLTVKELCVQQGQEVKKGDVLLIYDETQAALALEKAELSLEQVQLGIQIAEKNLDTLNNLSPVSDGGGYSGDVFPDEPEEKDPVQIRQEILDRLKAATEMTGDSLAINDPDTLDKLIQDHKIKISKEERAALQKLIDQENKEAAAAGDPLGSRRNPYRFLVKNDAIITIQPSFIQKLIEKAEKQYAADKTKKVSEKDKAIYFILEAHDGNTVSGEVIGGKVWGRNAYQLREEKKALQVDFYQMTPERVPEKEKETETETEKETEKPEPTEAETESAAETETETETATETEKETETETESETETETERQTETKEIPETETKTGQLTVTPVRGKRLAQAFDLFSAEGDTSTGKNYSSTLISSNASYTASELKAAIHEEEENLRDLRLQEREANLNLKKARKAKEAGKEVAAMDGVVTTAGDLENPPKDGSPFLQVAGTAGLYVTGGLSELLLGEIAPGDSITVLSWQTGSSYEAEITDISPYPDNSGQFSYGGMAASASYYPFTARILDENAKLGANEYLDISLSGRDPYAAMYGESDELYLYKAFILDEGSSKYVFKRGDNGKLVKQEIQTGQLRGAGCQILSGVKQDDWIAFPYGKKVKEGAACREATVMELYEAER